MTARKTLHDRLSTLVPGMRAIMATHPTRDTMQGAGRLDTDLATLAALEKCVIRNGFGIVTFVPTDEPGMYRARVGTRAADRPLRVFRIECDGTIKDQTFTGFDQAVMDYLTRTHSGQRATIRLNRDTRHIWTDTLASRSSDPSVVDITPPPGQFGNGVVVLDNALKELDRNVS